MNWSKVIKKYHPLLRLLQRLLLRILLHLAGGTGLADGAHPIAHSAHRVRQVADDPHRIRQADGGAGGDGVQQRHFLTRQRPPQRVAVVHGLEATACTHNWNDALRDAPVQSNLHIEEPINDTIRTNAYTGETKGSKANLNEIVISPATWRRGSQVLLSSPLLRPGSTAARG